MGAFVYILASKKNGTLYVGVTNDLVRRVWEHKQGKTEGFTKSYAITQLVYFEPYESIELAITREKAIKRWKRLWRIRLIEKSNPNWDDLYPHICQ